MEEDLSQQVSGSIPDIKQVKVYISPGKLKKKFPDPLGLHRYITKDNLKFCTLDRGFIKNWTDSWWRAYDLAIKHWAKAKGMAEAEANQVKAQHERIYKKYILRFIMETTSKPHSQPTWLPPVENPYEDYFGPCWCGCGRKCMWRCWDCNLFFANYVCGIRNTRWNGSTAYNEAWYQRCDRCVPEEDLCFCGCGNFADYLCSKCKTGFHTNCGLVRYNYFGSIYSREDLYFNSKNSGLRSDAKTIECSRCNNSEPRSVCSVDPNSECLGFAGADADLSYEAKYKASLSPPICNCRNNWKTDMWIN